MNANGETGADNVICMGSYGNVHVIRDRSQSTAIVNVAVDRSLLFQEIGLDASVVSFTCV